MSLSAAGIQVVGQVLPDEFSAVLRSMRAEADPRYVATLAQAVRDGWTLTALGDALGITREGVRIRIVKGYTEYPTKDLPEIPRAPRRPTPTPKVRRRLLLNEEMAERLRSMQAVAVTVTGGTPVDSEKRRISEEFSAILADLVEQGVTANHIAQVLGLEPSGVYARLARHGYRKPSPSVEREVYRNEQVKQVQSRTHCKQGHPLSGDNVYMTPAGQRSCKVCQRRRSRESYHRRKAATP